MSLYKFSHLERYAVYTVHSEACYLCRNPIDMVTFQVDHVLPEHLADQSDELQSVIASYGLPADFKLNSFENWLPSCASCNNQKKGTVFKALPIIAVQLQKASDKAEKARELANETRSKQQVSRAITILETASEQGILNELQLSRLKPLVEYHHEHREPELSESPIMLAPLLEVLSQNGEVITVKGLYGVGLGMASPPLYANFRCPSCGHSAWNGARCMVCGEQDDG